MVMEKLSTLKTQSWLGWFLRGVLILGFVILIGRLIELQIIKGDYYRDLAEGNRIRRVPITAPRGTILARGGELLVGNKEVKKRVIFDPASGYEKTEDISDATEEEIIAEWERDYYLGAAAAHISGYVGEVNEEELGTIDPQCPEKGPRKIGQLVGRSGLEEQYECILSGIDGEELVEVDSTGKKIRVLGKKNPVPGTNIQTTIHYDLQKKVAEIIVNNEDMPSEKQGAVIITDPRGEVLALYSSPSYDPNIFVGGDEQRKIGEILTDSDLPLFNRVIGGSFAPGSVYKPVVAIAALEEEEIDEEYTYEDTGQITIESLYGKYSYSNWYFTQYGQTEGEIDLVRAIARSTDTFFYKIGELVGIEKLVGWSHKMGLGEKTGIDLPGEISGLIPSPEWKERVKGERWFLGNTYHVAIGQGDLFLTPIGINTAISAIAANGFLCEARIVRDEKCEDLDINTSNMEIVKKGMAEVCTEGGTGFTFFDFNPQAACKTGTAETNDEDATHAWFTVFAPSDFPEIVTTVLVEKGGEGSRIAGPIAREIFDYWFSDRNE
jgi:penicillin-binding protein 2